jgi:NhaP-type Na+/H+ or K+/H+ antiporter
MDWALASVAVVLLAFAAVSRRVDGTSITPAMVFAGSGLLLGSEGLGLLTTASSDALVKHLAEATLGLILFADASRIDLRPLRAELAVPVRLLGVGLPLSIAFGFLFALAILDALVWSEALLVAVILAPTDAALAQAVVTEQRLPSRIRQGLNIESGLNDGLCVPLFLIVLAVANAETGVLGRGAALHVFAEQIGYGILGGVLAGLAGTAVLLLGRTGRSTQSLWLQVVPVASAALAFGIADPIGGSGFIAAFVGGMVFGALHVHSEEDPEYLIEEAGTVLNAVTFMIFGAALLGPALRQISWPAAAYAALSLTLIRMVPVALALIGLKARWPTVAFLGWFGPRGLASIVFAIFVVEEANLPHEDAILTVLYGTIGLSVLAHGLTAAPMTRKYIDWYESHPADRRPAMETVPAHAGRWRPARWA